MGKPNFNFQKRQKELAKKKKNEEKRQRKLAKNTETPVNAGQESADADGDDKNNASGGGE